MAFYLKILITVFTTSSSILTEQQSARRGLLDEVSNQMHSLQRDVESIGLLNQQLSTDAIEGDILEQMNSGPVAPADGVEEEKLMTEVEFNDAAHLTPYLFNGDMRVTKQQIMDYESVSTATNNSMNIQKRTSDDSKSGAPNRDAVVAKGWSGGVVPYTFSPSFTSAGRAAVLQAIREFRQRTCIRFVPRRGEYNYVEFINGRGCWSWAGMQGGGRQRISLQEGGCTRKGIALHEMMHSLGYEHEHTRPDRDRFIQIVWNNVRTESRAQFRVYKSYTLTKQYDYNSIMHYPARAFAKWRFGRTIIPRRLGVYIGQRWGLSRLDVLSINRLYCNNKG